QIPRDESHGGLLSFPAAGSSGQHFLLHKKTKQKEIKLKWLDLLQAHIHTDLHGNTQNYYRNCIETHGLLLDDY
ncbi:hypothetical protein DVA76_18615, partial [Acinetobacter baumannii]